MDYAFMGSLMTVVMLATFLGIVVWAWSAKRQAAFEAAARVPLEEDEPDSFSRPGQRQGNGS
jgi:cytochrome c oxidase cbb3-type subunit 4